MAKFTVSVQWEKTYEADDEGDALIQACCDFDLISEARAECDDDEEFL